MSELDSSKQQAADDHKPFGLLLEPEYEPAEGDRKFIAALAKGLNLLRVFQSRIGPLSHKELVGLSGYPKATVSRMTYTLVQTGYLQQRADGLFEISPRVLSLGYPLLVSQRVRTIAHDYMAEIASMGNYTLALAVPDGLSMVYIDECTGSSMNKLRLDVGARIEMARSSSGRAYLAALDAERQQEYFDLFQHRYAEHWQALQPRVEASLEEVSQRGFCLVDREWRKDTRGVAVPLRSADGATVMSLNCAAPVYGATNEVLVEEMGPRLVNLASNLSLLIGT